MNKFDTTRLEEALKTIIASLDISKKVYSVRPYSVPEATTDFIVARVGNDIVDNGCYGVCRVYISLFAKNVDGLKNGAKLSRMYEKFIDGFPQSYGVYEFSNRPRVIADRGDDFNFHSRLIQIETIIKIS